MQDGVCLSGHACEQWCNMPGCRTLSMRCVETDLMCERASRGGPSSSGCTGAAARVLRRDRSAQAGSLEAAPKLPLRSRTALSEAGSRLWLRMAGARTGNALPLPCCAGA